MRQQPRVRLASPFASLVLAAASLASSACTLVGLAIGTAVDGKAAKKGPVAHVSGWEATQIGPGTTITVILEDGERIEGKYAGVESTPRSPEYGVRYAQAQARLSELPLPGLDQRVVVGMRSGRAVTGVFLGFEANDVFVQPDGEAIPRAYRLRDVASLSAENGAALHGTRLQELVADRRLPVRQRLAVGDRRVPFDQVKTVEFRRSRHSGKITGAAMGLTVDALLILAATSTDFGSNSGCRTPNCTNSCPYVYSFDGQRYTLDAEPFGQALFEAAQRPDWTRMDHLRPVDGTYRIRVANELDEIEYVDELKLLVAEVPAGGRLVPSAEGRLHLMTAPLTPARAWTLGGADVRALVRARDGSAWSSAPFATVAHGSDAGRDGVVLEFARPAGAEHVTLAFTARSTPWASRLLTRVLALQGRDLPAWTARMNGDAAARREFLTALGREGLLALRVWDGAGWRDEGALVNQGPAVWKEQAVRIDLRGIEGVFLRVRLDATPGMWMLDRASADYGDGAPPPVRELSPTSARDAEGRDLRALLAATDGRRLLLRRGDVADLTFTAAPGPDGMSLVPVLEATGYYTILVPAQGEPDRAAYQRLMREPGAFGAYARAGLRSEMEEALGTN
ncbi:MAG TPA: hypothetical protein VII13_09550 [Vicinamibacteria bacterium]